MEKIKFRRYDVPWKNHNYCILIPEDVEHLFVYDFGGEEGTGWVGTRKIIKTLMYAAAILGFNPTDKIIYFPIRKNKIPEFYSWADKCDLIFTTHQVQLKRSEWKDIRNTFKYIKEKTYVLNFDAERTERYFRNSLQVWIENPSLWNSTDSLYRKENLIEVMEEDTLFQIYSRKQFQQIFLDLHVFLQRNLERELLWEVRQHSVPFEYMRFYHKWIWYRKKKQVNQNLGLFVDYYDERVVRRAKQKR